MHLIITYIAVDININQMNDVTADVIEINLDITEIVSNGIEIILNAIEIIL